MLVRVARWCYHRRWLTLVVWIVALVGAQYAASSFGGDFASDFSLPGAESQKAFDLLRERFPQVSGDSSQLVFKAEAGVTDPEVKATMEALFADIEQVEHVEEVVDPYTAPTPQVSQDGTIAFAEIRFDVKASEVPKEIVDEILALGKSADGPACRSSSAARSSRTPSFNRRASPRPSR